MLVAASVASAADNQSLPGMTYASIQALPHFSGWWNQPEPQSVETSAIRHRCGPRTSPTPPVPRAGSGS